MGTRINVYWWLFITINIVKYDINGSPSLCQKIYKIYLNQAGEYEQI